MLNEIDLSRVDLNLLVLFDTVVSERHVGRAADKLHLSASAVSHGLGRLRRLLNDPLFLRTPKGVVPTGRALELAAPIAEILARVKSVVAMAAPFDPATSTRRFIIGAPDSMLAVFVPPLLEELRQTAPGIAISVRQLLPPPGETASDRAWRLAFTELEARAMDIAIIPTNEIPARFYQRHLYDEDFVIALRAGHPFAKTPTLSRYCEMQHLVVSLMGDPNGFVDEFLALQGYKRRIALTVPNFMFALSVLAETDLIAALPRRFTAMYGARFGIVTVEAPLALPNFPANMVTSAAAMMDTGIAWLCAVLHKAELRLQKNSRRPANRRQRA